MSHAPAVQVRSPDLEYPGSHRRAHVLLWSRLPVQSHVLNWLATPGSGGHGLPVVGRAKVTTARAHHPPAVQGMVWGGHWAWVQAPMGCRCSIPPYHHRLEHPRRQQCMSGHQIWHSLHCTAGCMSVHGPGCHCNPFHLAGWSHPDQQGKGCLQG